MDIKMSGYILNMIIISPNMLGFVHIMTVFVLNLTVFVLDITIFVFVFVLLYLVVEGLVLELPYIFCRYFSPNVLFTIF